MEREQQFDTGSVRINYTEFAALPGASPRYPIVLLHGGSARWQTARSIIPVLAGYGPV